MIGIVSALQVASLTLLLAATPERTAALPQLQNIVGLPVPDAQGFGCAIRTDEEFDVLDFC